jgi:hypothetical protein
MNVIPQIEGGGHDPLPMTKQLQSINIIITGVVTRERNKSEVKDMSTSKHMVSSDKHTLN